MRVNYMQNLKLIHKDSTLDQKPLPGDITGCLKLIDFNFNREIYRGNYQSISKKYWDAIADNSVKSVTVL